jgi:TonB family protein
VVAAVYGLGVLVFLLRLAFAYGFTWRLVRGSRLVERSAAGDIYESASIAVPVTTGWLRPKILLPRNWRQWEQAKLDAVFAHERAHARRADWTVAAMAAVNRSVFWFHPLAWWLERTLARLAEQACDDAVLREVGRREQYAEVLLDMAAQVKSRRGRVVWEVMAMAKATEVRVRIERILDETRPIPKAWNRWRWAGLVACGVPLIGVVSMLQLAPARAMEQDRPAAPAAPAAASVATVAPAPRAARKSAAPKSGTAAAAGLQPVKTVSPRYPAAARAAKVEGTVRLNITVGKDGTVTDVTSATGHPLLVPPAADAVRQWVYAPQPAEVRLQVEVPVHADHSTQALAMQAPASAPATEAPAVPTLLHRVEAVYPKIALQTGASGTVVLDVTIGRDGHVNSVRVRNGHPMLTNAAVEAVKQWVYAPSDSEVRTEVSIDFGGSRSSASGGPIQQAVLIYRKDATYPKEAKEAGITGTVTLNATIGTDGQVKEVHAISGDALLAQAAVEAVRQWRYRPTMLNGQPVETQTQVVVNFVGDGRSSLQARREPSPAADAFQGPVLLYRKQPEKPESVAGTVRGRATVGKDGRLMDIRIDEGDPALTPAAVNAFKQWMYRPATRNGEPVESEAQITLTFTAR